MTNARRTASNIQFAIGLLILLVALGMPWPSSARALSLELASQSARRSLRSSPYEFQGLEVEMMHFDHVASPYAQPQMTVAERVKTAVERSMERARFLEIKTNSLGWTSKVGIPVPDFHGQAEYLVNFSLGTPPQNFQGIADTGSDLVWVQCKPDSSPFPEPDPIFDPDQSSTYETVDCTSTNENDDYCQSCSQDGICQFELTYGDQSTTTGNLATETLTLGSVSGAPKSFTGFKFGCGHFANGTNEGDGLVGFGRGNDSIVSQLGSEIGHIFSYCLVDFTKATNTTSSLILGSAGPLPLNYTPLVTNPYQPSFYYVNLTGISVNGENIEYPADTFAIDENGNGGLILDSGTTVTSLDSRAYTPLYDRLVSLITYSTVNDSSTVLDPCYEVDVSNPTFPSVSFHFQGGLEVALPPDNLFTEQDGYYCLAIQAGDSFSIFGNIQQQNFQIAFDLANERVGFAPTTC